MAVAQAQMTRAEVILTDAQTFNKALSMALGARDEYLSHVYRYRAHMRAKAVGDAWDSVFRELMGGSNVAETYR